MSLIVIIYYKIFCEIKRRGNFSEINRNVSRVSCAHHRNQNKKHSPERSSSSLQTSKNSQSKVIAEEETKRNDDGDCFDNKDIEKNNEADEINSDSSSYQSELAISVEESDQKHKNLFYRLFYIFKDSKTSSRTSVTTSTLVPTLPPAPVSATLVTAPSCSTSFRRVHAVHHQQSNNNALPSVSSPPLASDQFSPNLRDLRLEQLK